MQFRTIGLLLLGAMALPASGAAQTSPAPPAITRTVVVATEMPTVTDVPLHFKAVSITLQPDEKIGIYGSGKEPLIFPAFNINPEGVAAVLPGAPATSQ